MKKLLIIMLILVFMLSSCQQKETIKFDYIFAKFNQVLMKIDVHTGRATPLCSDPLCDHLNDNCPFYNAGMPIPTKNNNKVYFTSNVTDYKTNTKNGFVKCYDLTTGEVEKCYETTNSLGSLFLSDKYLLFLETFYKDESKKSSGDESNLAMNILRYDTESKETVKLNSEPINEKLLLMDVYKDRLVWATRDLSSFYSTTFDYKDINYDVDSLYADEKKKEGTYIKFENDGPPKNTCTLYIISGDKKEEICKNVGDFKEYADYSIYIKSTDEKILIGEDASIPDMKYYKYNDNKLYYINNDGTDNKELCDFGEHYFSDIFIQSNYENYYGDYQLIRFNDYKFNSEGKIANVEEKFAVLNTKTGEYKFVEY